MSLSAQLNYQRIFGVAAQEPGHAIISTHDGGFAIAGHTSSFGADEDDIIVVKTDEFGTILWEKTFGSVLEDYWLQSAQSIYFRSQQAFGNGHTRYG